MGRGHEPLGRGAVPHGTRPRTIGTRRCPTWDVAHEPLGRGAVPRGTRPRTIAEVKRRGEGGLKMAERTPDVKSLQNQSFSCSGDVTFEPRRPRRVLRVTLRSAMTLDPALDAEVRSLVDEYRERCLWFVRSDYYPSTPDEILRVLRWIRARGDREAFQRAGKIEEWLSRTSSEKSAAS